MRKFKEINAYIKEHNSTADELVVAFPREFLNPPKGVHYLLEDMGDSFKLVYINRKGRIRIERKINK